MWYSVDQFKIQDKLKELNQSLVVVHQCVATTVYARSSRASSSRASSVSGGVGCVGGVGRVAGVCWKVGCVGGVGRVAGVCWKVGWKVGWRACRVAGVDVDLRTLRTLGTLGTLGLGRRVALRTLGTLRLGKRVALRSVGDDLRSVDGGVMVDLSWALTMLGQSLDLQMVAAMTRYQVGCLGWVSLQLHEACSLWVTRVKMLYRSSHKSVVSHTHLRVVLDLELVLQLGNLEVGLKLVMRRHDPLLVLSVVLDLELCGLEHILLVRAAELFFTESNHLILLLAISSHMTNCKTLAAKA